MNNGFSKPNRPWPAATTVNLNRSLRQRRCWRDVVLLAMVMLSMLGCGPAADDDALIAENNRGVGLMGQFQYTPAREVFAKLHAAHPENVEVAINLAIARLNEQGEANVARAMELLDAALERAPEHARANYCRGLLKLYAGEPQGAVGNFTIANEQHPRDADAAYLRGLCLEQSGEVAAAGPYYQQAVELEPYHASAVFGLSRVARQAEQMDAAQKYIDQFTKLKENPHARVFEFKYKAMGPLGEVWTIGKPAPPDAAPTGQLFAAVDRLETTPGPDPSGRLTLADINSDASLDVVVTSEETGCRIFLNDGEQRFAADDQHPLAGRPAIATLHGDLDNDGQIDHVVLGNAGIDLLIGSEVVALSEVVGEAFRAHRGVLFDADHDGDLDIYCVGADAADVLVNNNGDGTFRLLAEEQGIDSGSGPTQQVCVADFDNDRDLDLLVLKQSSELVMLENDRLWQYRRADFDVPLKAGRPIQCVVGDVNQDGWPDVLALVEADEALRLEVWHGGPDWQFTLGATRAAAAVGKDLPLALGDADGDGMPEIFCTSADARQVHVFDHELGELQKVTADGPATDWTLAAFDEERGPSLLLASDTGLLLAGPGEARHKFVTVSFGGKHDPGDSLRSNYSGIGTRWRARAGRYATAGVTLPHDTSAGQSLQPTQIGLGGKPQLDMLELVWPDGVFQSELALKPGASRQIVETQRQLSSCPVLFAWDGQAFQFVTDLIGVGGLGYLVQPGVYGTPRPFERLLLSSQQLVPQDGRLALKLGEPMEEACYLDHVAMQAVDVPPGWSVALDERAAVNPPTPTSELFYYRDAAVLIPTAANNDRGEDVLRAIAYRDDVAAAVGAIAPRFIGMLTQEHVLTIRFEHPLDRDGGSPVLLMDGWIEYPYSQTNFAAWQAGKQHEEPTIEARGADGQWVTVWEKFGYPAGMPRAMSVPLPDLPAGTRELRIRTNLEIYWDRVRVAFAEPCPAAEVIDLPFSAASLERVGFAARTTGPQRRPRYDYANRSATWDTRHPWGAYTRFGDVSELVDRRDDALAIFGPGEEVHFEFVAPTEAPKEGKRRWFVLSAAGWCKDMDLYTRTGGTLAPLPQRQTDGTPRREQLHSKYNTRWEAGK